MWSWDGEPFGNTPPTAETTGAGQFMFNLRFPGQYYDAETGLHYNKSRDYDPSSGRYVESDRIGLRGGISTFGYVGGQPTAYSDPAGRCPWCIAGAIIGGGLDLAAQYAKNGSFDNLNYTELGLATASGAIGGGMGAWIGGLTTNVWLAAAANAEVGAVTGLVSTGITNANSSCQKSLVTGTLVGGVFGAMGGFAGQAIGNWIGELGGVAQSSWNEAVNVVMPNLAPFGGTTIQGAANSAGAATSNAIGNTVSGTSAAYDW